MTSLQHVRLGAYYAVSLGAADDFSGWRDLARRLVMADVPPDRVAWTEPGGPAGSLFASAARRLPVPEPDAAQPRVPREFLRLAEMAARHSDAERFALLYRLLWRLQAKPKLLDDAADRDVRAVHDLARAVCRDIHKMRAFVRFRLVEDTAGGEHYVAWFEPVHHILRANARFFVDRFAGMRWSILTPAGSLHWDGETLSEGPPAKRGDAPAGDPAEDLWRRYYASIFNPARLKIGAMLKEMPRKYWHNMPETQAIAGLVAGAQSREAGMVAKGRSLFEDAERPHSLAGVAEVIAQCRRCPIGCNGTRAVAGEGPAHAPLMVVGEQPGDTEEEIGRPFVGPAGQLLDRHLERAGLDRGAAYVTNAVKHFKFVQRGKRRLHQSPTAGEIDTCRWWLEAETALVKPTTVLAMGASAARAMLGRSPSVQKERGAPIALPDGRTLWITVHPSYLLRLRDEAREAESVKFAADLKAGGRSSEDLSELLQDIS